MIERNALLTGLDGTNPLGFFAALGTLKILHEQSIAENAPLPRLAWENDGRWRPRLWGVPDIETVVDAVLKDRQTWQSEPALELAYDESGNLVEPSPIGHQAATDLQDGDGEDGPEPPSRGQPEGRRAAKNADRMKRDLKPTTSALRAFFLGLVESGHERRVRSLAMAAAFGTETAVDNNGNVKPTAFHFTAGQQMFLAMVRDLRGGIGRAHIEEALIGPWKNASTLPSLSWDAAAARIYALRAANPSGEKRGSVPGANWLAFVGLQFFPLAPLGGQVATPCVTGGWKDAKFRWPLWRDALTADAVTSLLRMGRFVADPGANRAMGIETVLESAILRAEQRGYGSFAPASVFL